ncbi:MAG: FAD-binding oxidoreductase [Bacteroidetes bacterium]|nr:FAD-binding oxidoreductase [Bacteroidota bacterium]
MNLRSAEPFWPFHTPVLTSYPALRTDVRAAVVVVGSGITGALAAYELVKAGCQVVLISKTRPASESTAATTALLQYEIDTPLRELIDKVGPDHASRSYLLCHESIDQLAKVHEAVGAARVFHKRKSLLLAALKKDVPDLEREYQLRSDIGIKVQWLEMPDVKERWGLDNVAAIYSAQAAETDAYLLAQKILQWCTAHGMQVYDHAEVTAIHESPREVTLHTSKGYNLRAKYVVMATGYEGTQWLDRNVARLHSTYAIISKPVPREQLWRDRCLIWDTGRPYLYLRTTEDNRIIIGGKDEPWASGHKRDILIRRKSEELCRAFRRKFPYIDFQIDYEWAGTFGETADGLPYIGAAKPRSRVLYSLGYGGNGITFSQIGAVILRDIITGQRNKDVAIFSFDRLDYQ